MDCLSLKENYQILKTFLLFFKEVWVTANFLKYLGKLFLSLDQPYINYLITITDLSHFTIINIKAKFLF